MKKKWFFIVPLIVVLVGISYLVITSVNVENKASLVKYIEKEADIHPETILKTTKYGDLFAVLYSDETAEEMMILEKNPIGRYKYFGGGFSPSDISTYNYNEANSWSLIIVYGNNTRIGAHSYEFTNDNKKFSSSNLEDYILDIYIIEDSKFAESEGFLLDENGNKLEMF